MSTCMMDPWINSSISFKANCLLEWKTLFDNVVGVATRPRPLGDRV